MVTDINECFEATDSAEMSVMSKIRSSIYQYTFNPVLTTLSFVKGVIESTYRGDPLPEWGWEQAETCVYPGDLENLARRVRAVVDFTTEQKEATTFLGGWWRWGVRVLSK